jgi:uncharacterized protein YegL
MKIKRKKISILLLSFLTVVVLVACESPPPVPETGQNIYTSGQGKKNTSQEESTDEIYVKKPSWPPAPEDRDIIQLASNMLAKNYVIVLDDSGSMGDRDCSGDEFPDKMEAAKYALSKFVKAVPVDVNLGLVTFDQNAVRVQLGNNNRDVFIKTVNSEMAEHSTPLDSAIRIAYSVITEQAQKQSGYGEYHIVIVTDGAASIGQDPTEAVNQIVDSTPITIHTIGFCIGKGHSLNQPGRTEYKTADNPEALVEGLESILAEAPTFDISEFTQ